MNTRHMSHRVKGVAPTHFSVFPHLLLLPLYNDLSSSTAGLPAFCPLVK